MLIKLVAVIRKMDFKIQIQTRGKWGEDLGAGGRNSIQKDFQSTFHLIEIKPSF